MSKYVHTDVEWAQNLERSFKEYMASCEAQADDEWAEELAEENFTTVSGIEFCGCPECYTREAIMFLIPQIIDGYTNGKLVRED